MSQQRAQTVVSFKYNGSTMPANRVVYLSEANGIALPNTNTCKLVGVSLESASSTGEAVSVVIAGSAKIQAGTNLSAGDLLTFVTTTGEVMSQSATWNTTTSVRRPIVGIALEAGSKSSTIEVLLQISNLWKQASA